MSTQPRGWMLTAGLAALALLGGMLAPRLASQAPPEEPELGADLCVRVGPYECCYVPEE